MNRIQKFDDRIKELFTLNTFEERKKYYEDLYEELGNHEFEKMIYEIYPKFFRLVNILKVFGTTDDIRQDIFLELWKEIKDNNSVDTGPGYFKGKLEKRIKELLTELLHLTGARIDDYIDVESNLTMKTLENIREQKPLFLTAKLEYFKQVIEITGNSNDFMEKIAFLFKFFLEVPDELTSSVIGITPQNLQVIYSGARRKILTEITNSRLLEYEPIILELKSVNSMDTDEDLQAREDYEIFELRCIKHLEAEEICSKLKISRREFQLRLLDFFTRLQESPVESVFSILPEEEVNMELLDTVMNRFEEGIDPSVLEEQLSVKEKLFFYNYIFLLKMTRVNFEFRTLGDYLRYRLAGEEKNEYRNFLKKTKINEDLFKKILDDKVFPEEDILEKINEFLFLPANYLIGFSDKRKN